MKHRVHVVNTFYPDDRIRALALEAAQAGVAILPEFGMDPGIDLVFLGHTVRALDRVEEVWSYGAGFPEPAASGNPLRYKVTWTFEGVLKSYLRAGRVIRGGRVVEIPEREMFSPEHLHDLELEGLGRLEAFPNGDALKYADLLELDRGALRQMGRYVLRWPGHSAFWKTLVDLRLLDEGSVLVDGHPVDRRRFLCASLEPQLSTAPGSGTWPCCGWRPGASRTAGAPGCSPSAWTTGTWTPASPPCPAPWATPPASAPSSSPAASWPAGACCPGAGRALRDPGPGDAQAGHAGGVHSRAVALRR